MGAATQRSPRGRAVAACGLLGVLLLAIAAPAESRPSRKKAIWGPAHYRGVSQFPIYRDLGVGIYQTKLNWSRVARRRPRHPTNPRDPAYRWPGEVSYAIREGRRHGIRVAIMLTRAPRWANGGRGSRWAPRRARDFAYFARAAARRFPSVRHWLIWGEPSRKANFQPLPPHGSRGPRIYARILDAAYGQLKRQSRRNLVIGGNTFTAGEVPPLEYIKLMRLPGGRRPRMDMYGHNPFSARGPDLRKPPLGRGFADFSDLDTLARYVDRNLKRRRPRLKLFLSEFTAPTEHANHEFTFWVTRATQARWVRSALRITRRWWRIYTLGWVSLYDETLNGPNGTHGDESHRGLIDWLGRKKPAYYAFKRG